jgi:hypothetical protein
MAARLDMILAHLQALTLDVPANLIVANLMNARYSGAPARDTKLKIDKPEMNEALARNVVDKLAVTIQESVRVAGPAFRAAYDKAIEAAGRINGFTKEHPVWTVVIVLCILAVMYPAAIKALGFGLEGVVEGNNPLVVWASSFELTELPGSYAAGWQSTYGAAVPAGSLFSCLQRVGATMAF